MIFPDLEQFQNFLQEFTPLSQSPHFSLPKPLLLIPKVVKFLSQLSHTVEE